MKKLFGLIVGAILALPLGLSFAAEYYLKHHLAKQFSTPVELSRLDFNHGWFESDAQVELYFPAYDLSLSTQNTLHQGPIIWKQLLSEPLKSFAWYDINSQFDLANRGDLDANDQKGSAHTRVNYLGQTHPVIHHPGLQLNWRGSQLFSDVTTIESQIDANGTSTTRYTGNQIEFNDPYQNLYVTEPQINITSSPALPLPAFITASANTFSGLFGGQTLLMDDISLSSEFVSHQQNFRFSSIAQSNNVQLNQASLSPSNITLTLDNISPDLIDYLALHGNEINHAITQTQWLVLLKHVAEIVKLVGNDQPELNVQINAKSNSQAVLLGFRGKIINKDEDGLNPFALLENLDLELNTELPASLISELANPDLNRFIQSMLEKNIMIEHKGVYYAKLRFKDTKLKLAHVQP